mgnify:CR=1 FL=1
MGKSIQSTELPAGITAEERIAKALKIAVQYGGIDGAHHKDWCIDQMVRALTGCPLVRETLYDYKQTAFDVLEQGESEEYKALVSAACAGPDGPETWSWETGIAP